MCRCSWRVIETSLAFAKASSRTRKLGVISSRSERKNSARGARLASRRMWGKAPQSSFPTPNGARAE